jgi:hypothetical protein
MVVPPVEISTTIAVKNLKMSADDVFGVSPDELLAVRNRLSDLESKVSAS